MTSSPHPLEEAIAYTFVRKDLLDAALTHKSAMKDHKGRTVRTPIVGDSRERLEFLGDRVLGLAIAESLYRSYGKEKEGDLAKRLATLVSKESCTKIAQKLDLVKYLKVAANDLTSNSHIVPDALEALLGAVFLDGGFEEVKRVTGALWQDLLNQDLIPPQDAKTALQEWAQANYKSVPEYTLISRTGPDHAPIFHVEVKISGMGEAAGDGITKKEAEQRAARNLMDKVKR